MAKATPKETDLVEAVRNWHEARSELSAKTASEIIHEAGVKREAALQPDAFNRILCGLGYKRHNIDDYTLYEWVG